jgi:hypothetical protein
MSLAVGNFHGYVGSIDDLVVGAPGQTLDDDQSTGNVYDFAYSLDRWGGGGWFNKIDDWDQDRNEIIGTNTDGDRFGSSLAVGDFNGDGRQDLTIGVPNQYMPNYQWEIKARAGETYTIYADRREWGLFGLARQYYQGFWNLYEHK